MDGPDDERGLPPALLGNEDSVRDLSPDLAAVSVLDSTQRGHGRARVAAPPLHPPMRHPRGVLGPGPFTRGRVDISSRWCPKTTRSPTSLRCSRPQMSGRQDSNLRPLVPQTSPHFPIRVEFDLQCFRREMVGMTTRARVMDCVGTPRLDALRTFSVQIWQQVPSPRSAGESLR